jgi:hypothetical protein
MAKEVDAGELNHGKRGRQSVRIASVLKAMQGLKEGKALILDEFGPVEDKTDQSRIYQAVRAHWFDVREDKPKISFDPDTKFVQVQAGKAKK